MRRFRRPVERGRLRKEIAFGVSLRHGPWFDGYDVDAGR